MLNNIDRETEKQETTESRRLDTKQAAAYLGLAVQSMHNRRHLRLPPEYFKIGTKILYDTKILNEFLESHRVKLNA